MWLGWPRGEGRCLRWGPKGVATKCHSTTRRHKHTGDSKSAEQFGGRRVSLIEPSDWAAPMSVHRASRWHVCLRELLLQTMLKCARISHAWITGERCFLYYISSQHFDLVQAEPQCSSPARWQSICIFSLEIISLILRTHAACREGDSTRHHTIGIGISFRKLWVQVECTSIK